MDITPFIKELILVKECVILPDFGGFETFYQSARKDYISKVIIPPSKKVVFRRDMLKDNGILRNFLAEKLNIHPEQANSIILEWIHKLKSDLLKRGEVLIETLGTFKLNEKDEVTYVPLTEDFYSAESFGLEKIPFDKQLPPKVEPEIQKTKVTSKEKTKEKVKEKKKTGIVIGAVALFVITLLLLVILLNEKLSEYNSVFNIFSFGKKDSSEIVIFGKKKKNKNEEKMDEIIEEKTSSKKALDPFATNNTKKEQKRSVAEAPVQKYYIVAGSFKNMRNAEILKNNLTEEGFSPSIVEINHYYRVVLKSFNDRDEAINELRRIRAQVNKSLWLLSV